MKTAYRLAAIATALAVAACGGGAAAPDDHHYRLDVVAPGQALKQPLLSGVLEVQRFAAEGLVGERAMVYAVPDEPFEIHKYNYHFWNEPPGAMVQDQMIRYLRKTNLADKVVSPELHLKADYVIEGRVRRFDQLVGQTTHMVLEIELGLIRMQDEKLILLKTYRADEPAASDSAPAAVAAANKALSELFEQFVADLTRTRVKV